MVVKALTAAQARIKALEEQGETQRGQIVVAKNQARQAEVASTASVKELERRQADFEAARVYLKKATDDNTQLIKETTTSATRRWAPRSSAIRP